MRLFSHHFCGVFLPVAVLVLLLSVAIPTSWAQKDMGSIVGSVKDGTGAVIADAKVVITDVDRGTLVNTISNASGEYVSGPLRIGQYLVTVEKSGFKKAVAGPVALNVQDRLAVDVTLQVGTFSETMTVSTTAAQLETETSELGQVVNGRTATTLASDSVRTGPALCRTISCSMASTTTPTSATC